MKLRCLLIALAVALPFRGLVRGVLILGGAALLAFSPRLAQAEFCGDGILDLYEQCDDGNSASGDGCDPACQLEASCGDGLVQPGEQCDPGTGATPDPRMALASSPFCDADCTLAECGDGFTNPAAGEQCDDGNDPNNDGCDEFCMDEGGEVAGGSVGPGGMVTTDTEFGGDGATASDPVETTVTTPNGGSISIDEGPITGTATAFRFFGQEVEITAPDATASNPLVLVFELDATIIPEGEDETSIAVFKDGIFVPGCTGAPGTADPDACVSARVLQGDGDIEITILSSTASEFDFGEVGCPAVPAENCNQQGLNITIVADKGQVGNVVTGKAKVIFKWLKGSGIGQSQADYGDPTDEDSILLCLYKDGELEFEMKAPPQGVWKKISEGFKYSDKALSNAGIKKILLKGGFPGKAKVMVIGKGVFLPIPDIQQELDPDSTYNIQVQSTVQNCWGMSYVEGQASNVKGVFKLKRQGP
ncbi:MAG: DUF4215 domain-containing protein [Deltaproteobacteria bacterium]|nr:MAG: DUF4215 domain-containing protein [Deltaproteobacteria bacterium]